LVWDNYPVNDGSMERSLHLGPYRGREPGLADATAGVLCNPMLQARASLVALATAADFLRDPDGYDPDAALARAAAEVGGARGDALRSLASACADGPLLPPHALVAHRLTDGLERAEGGPGWDRALLALRSHLEEVRDGAAALAGAADDPLGAEVRPWLAQARRETRAGLAALQLLERVGTASPEPADAPTNLLYAFATLLAWNGARRRDHVVFGPRFALYPAVVQLADGQPGLDVSLALVEDRNAIDRLCRMALDRYQAWQRHLGELGCA
jgi:hyaluronoglucosaminidase